MHSMTNFAENVRDEGEYLSKKCQIVVECRSCCILKSPEFFLRTFAYFTYLKEEQTGPRRY